MVLANDTRGWIMTCLSGIACVLGASIICVDLVIRLFPGKRNFRIQDSNMFLSSALSLSFGVMLFSSLYSMLPSAKSSLEKGGLSPKEAAWTLVGCFLAGVIGIQIVSRVLHAFMPSHVVDCDHTHDEDPEHSAANEQDNHATHKQPLQNEQKRTHVHRSMSRRQTQPRKTMDEPSYFGNHGSGQYEPPGESEPAPSRPAATPRRPSLQARLTARVSQLVSGSKSSCDEDGPCHGYSDPCGQECFKIVQARGGTRMPSFNSSRRPQVSRGSTAPQNQTNEATPLLQDISEEDSSRLPEQARNYLASGLLSHDPPNDHETGLPRPRSSTPTTLDGASSPSKTRVSSSSPPSHEAPQGGQHHHHVPTNAFLSIGLQTSIAIALHKLPEGFITYATNHANPSLGFAVFLALFIHNITEGFAMALPLYLAIGSRPRAMFWSSLLGGFSQPCGAAVAALWFRLAGGSGSAPGEEVYGAMFAVTAGIMASVALQLFSESLDLTHNRGLCMGFAFVGMGVLGVSSALTA